MTHRHKFWLQAPVAALALAALALGVCPIAGGQAQQVTPDELKMTDAPEAPGAPAIILYRQVDRDDNALIGHEDNYLRIKILTEEGRKYADVEIPYLKDRGSIVSINGRTIRPDGTVAPFDGRAYDKTIVKARGVQYLAKTFTLPDVQIGSVIEYRYVYDMAEHYVFDSNWILSNELFTRYARFSLKPNKDFALRWTWPSGLPTGSTPPKEEPSTHILRMEAHNIPAFQIEDYMPPADQLKFRVEFNYSEASYETEPDRFWKQQGKKLNGKVESFTNKRKPMEEAVSQTVAPGDSPEVKAQKLYARVQKMRNTTYEAEKTEQEQKREKAKEGNVEEILRQGSGDADQIAWLYLALVKAAGIEAYPVKISRRNEYLFLPKMMNVTQLNGNVVLLKLNGKDVYCDPGTPFVPFGLLPWSETGVTGLKLDKEGGSWVETTMPQSAESKISRKADLKMADDGTLWGKVTITFTGLEAVTRRLEVRSEDDTAKKKYLEDQLREYVPVGIDVDLTNKPDWTSSSTTLLAEYDLKVPGWASAAGHFAVLQTGIFSATEKQVFEHAGRVYPVYFHFPFEKQDEVTIQLPLGWTVKNLSKPVNQDSKAVAYTLKVEDEKGTLHLTRTLKNDLVFVEAKLYPTLRSFYQMVRKEDEEQIVVQPGAATAVN